MLTSRILPLPQARAGMTLAAPACDGAGREVLPAGTELTPPLLASLERHGVAQLDIAVPADERLARLFRLCDPQAPDFWATKQLHDYLAAYRAGGRA